MKQERVSAVAARHKAAREELERVSLELRAVIVELGVHRGLGAREIGRMLGVSHSYVLQVVGPLKANKKAKKPTKTEPGLADILPIAR